MNEDDAQETLISSQLWKFYVGGVGIVIFGVGFYAADYLSIIFAIDPDVFRISMVSLGFLLFAYPVFFVRCPSCGLGLVGYAMTNQPHDLWHIWLLVLKNCPKCGQKNSICKNG